jgi:hypothetical protein
VRSAKNQPGAVSDETLTKRGTSQRTAASIALNVDIRLFWNTTWGGLPVGSGIAAVWITASWPRATA